MDESSLRSRLDALPVWVGAAAVSVLVRMGLALLPAPGRDEAAYYSWSRNAEWGYAPLMTWSTRILETIGLPSLVAIRLPSFLGGLLALALFDRLLQHQGLGRRGRALATLTLALTPWQIYVGSFSHPDTLFLSCLLGLALALRADSLRWIALLGAAAALAKPTGLVLIPFLLLWLMLESARGRWERGSAALLLLAGAAPALSGLSTAMLSEMLQFGRLPSETPWVAKSGIALASLAFEGGLLLPVVALVGLGHRWGQRDRQGRAVLWIAIPLLALFLGAALFRGQIKGGWFLPALVVLWPPAALRLPSTFVGGGVALTVLASLLMVGGMRQPGLCARLESRLGWEHLYALRAGEREARVSATRTFSQRFLEYRDLTSWGTEMRQHWQNAVGSGNAPRWIVSDDYGLGAQLAYQWQPQAPALVVPRDGMFQGREDEVLAGHAADVLFVAIQRPLSDLLPEIGSVQPIGTLDHPVTGDPVLLGTVSSPLQVGR